MKLQPSTESYRTEHSFTHGPKIHNRAPKEPGQGTDPGPGQQVASDNATRESRGLGETALPSWGTVLTHRLSKGRDRPHRRAH